MTNLLQGRYEKAKSFYENEMQTKSYFEFCLSYVSDLEPFREIDRFLWESKHLMTRFKNRYEGAVLIDISAWNDAPINEYFYSFLYFLKDSNALECTFIVDDKCKKEFLENLNSFFDIKVIQLESNENKKSKKIGFCIESEENCNVRI